MFSIWSCPKFCSLVKVYASSGNDKTCRSSSGRTDWNSDHRFLRDPRSDRPQILCNLLTLSMPVWTTLSDHQFSFFCNVFYPFKKQILLFGLHVIYRLQMLSICTSVKFCEVNPYKKCNNNYCLFRTIWNEMFS